MTFMGTVQFRWAEDYLHRLGIKKDQEWGA